MLLCKMLILFQELVIERGPTEKIGMTIKGGAGGTPGNPNDSADEGVFVSKVCTILTLTVTFFTWSLKVNYH